MNGGADGPVIGGADGSFLPENIYD